MSFETPPRPRWILRISLALGTVLMLVLGVVAVVVAVRRCAEGVWVVRDECIGVTDGSYSFSPELEDVATKIWEENKEAEKDSQYVTVAVMMPMTASDSGDDGNDSLTVSQIREYLQGAYIAQQAANSDANGLRIRLALANEGRNEHAGAEVTDQLLKMADVPGKVDAPDNLVAVTGLGLSSPETVTSAKKLGNAGIPMVGYLSADGFNHASTDFGSPIPNLTRVSASLADEVAALAAHFERVGKKPSSALLVQDDNPDDYYTKDLRKNFIDQFHGVGGADELPSSHYTGGPAPYNLNTRFDRIADRLCDDDELDTVLYAGRSNLLPAFVEQISKRFCPKDQEITVVTGSESTDLPIEPQLNARTGVSVLYASVSDPAALDDEKNRFRVQHQDFVNALRQQFGDRVDESNWTLMGHDATYTSIEAAKRAVQQVNVRPNKTAVRDSLSGMNYSGEDISGASGRFYFDGNGDRVSGAIPVLRRNRDGFTEVLNVGGLGG